MRWLSRLWGDFILSMSQIGVVLTTFTMAFSAIAAFPTIQEWFLQLRITVTLWEFGIVAIVILLAALQFVKKKATPNYLRTWNREWWNASNPMRAELKQMEERLSRRIDAISNHKDSYTTIGR